jgi:hypothetical protein
MRRRTFVGAAALPLAACGVAEVQTFPTLAAARRAIDGLASGWKTTGAWPIATVLNHAAQSVEYSLRGFPEPKSALFRATLGRAAFAWFDSRGAMTHGLAEPIPGAPVLAADVPLAAAIERLQKALADFEAHTGALAPHFAYGALDKPQYTRAHLMHLANHWQEFTRS